jgi:hypothetical protein
MSNVWFRPFAVTVPEEDCLRYFECSDLCQSMNSLATVKHGTSVLPEGLSCRATLFVCRSCNNEAILCAGGF